MLDAEGALGGMRKLITLHVRCQCAVRFGEGLLPAQRCAFATGRKRSPTRAQLPLGKRPLR
jgi:hypothetical protein